MVRTDGLKGECEEKCQHDIYKLNVETCLWSYFNLKWKELTNIVDGNDVKHLRNKCLHQKARLPSEVKNVSMSLEKRVFSKTLIIDQGTQEK